MFQFTDQRNKNIVSYMRQLKNVYMNRNRAKLKISRTTINSLFSKLKILDEKIKSDDQGDFH